MVYQTFFFAGLILAGVNTIHAAVDECPGIDVPNIEAKAADGQFHVSLVLYHVSWANYSRSTKAIYDEVADYYQDNGSLYFAAVDCWHLACNCSRIMHTNSMRPNEQWPKLFLNYSSRISIQYHGGWNFADMTRFLSTLLFMPLERIHGKNELKTLTMQSDAVVLGLFPNSDAYEYSRFSDAAVKWLENDPERSFRFAAIFGAAAQEVLNGTRTEMPVILLFRSQGVEVFNSTGKWSAIRIANWVRSQLKDFKNVNGYSTLSTLAFDVVQRPVLTIFANELNLNNNFYSTLAAEVDTSMQSLYEFCKAFWNTTERNSDYTIHMKTGKDEGKSVCHQKVYLSAEHMQNFYRLNDYWNRRLDLFKPTVSYEREDPNSADKLLQLHQQNKCLNHRQYNTPKLKIGIAKFLKKSLDRLWLNSLPQYNRSLAVVILDSRQHQHFLNLHQIYNSPSSAAAVLIVDSRKESIFVMPEQFSYEALLGFAKRFYENNLLTAHHQSSSSPLQINPADALNAVYLQDHSRLMFLNAIQQENTTTVVLLYSPTCAFSARMSQVLMQVKALLSSNDDDPIKFIRLNTQSNDLPWEFLMPTTPTIMVFPRSRFMDSRVFPSHLKINVRHVYGFILAQLEPVEQAKVILSSCRRSLAPQRLQKCMQFAKTLAMQHIGQHLKLWQRFEGERHFVLDRLKEFKDITLDIQRSIRL